MHIYIEENLGGKYIVNTSPSGINLDGQAGVKKVSDYRYQVSLARLKKLQVGFNVWASKAEFDRINKGK